LSSPEKFHFSPTSFSDKRNLISPYTMEQKWMDETIGIKLVTVSLRKEKQTKHCPLYSPP